MAVTVTATGLTNQQKIDLADAFEATQGPRPDGMTKAQFVSLCTLRFWKSVVKGWKRGAHESAAALEAAQVEAEYGDQVE